MQIPWTVVTLFLKEYIVKLQILKADLRNPNLFISTLKIKIIGEKKRYLFTAIVLCVVFLCYRTVLSIYLFLLSLFLFIKCRDIVYFGFGNSQRMKLEYKRFGLMHPILLGMRFPSCKSVLNKSKKFHCRFLGVQVRNRSNRPTQSIWVDFVGLVNINIDWLWLAVVGSFSIFVFHPGWVILMLIFKFEL